MTVPSTRFREDYAGNGSATSFPYAFRIFKAADLVVTKTDSSGNDTTLTLGTDYTVTGAGSYNGGAVVLTTALPTSYRLTIERVLAIKQDTDLRNQGDFFAETHEDAFDRLTMIVQRLAGYLGMGQDGTLRTLLLGTSDLDGAGAFRARGNRISGLGDPVDDTDAAGKRWTQEQIASAVSVDGSSLLGVFAITIDTIAGASGLLWPDKATVIARGRDAVGDDGGGQLRFLKGSTATANGVTIYAVAGGRLVREGWTVFGINVKWAGAKGNGIFDDTASFVKVRDYLASVGGGIADLPHGSYVLNNFVIDKPNIIFNGLSSGWTYNQDDSPVKITPAAGAIFSARLKGTADGVPVNACDGSGFRNIMFYDPEHTAEYNLFIDSGLTIVENVSLLGSKYNCVIADQANQNIFRKVSMRKGKYVNFAVTEHQAASYLHPNVPDISTISNTIIHMEDVNIRQGENFGAVIRSLVGATGGNVVIESNKQAGLYIYRTDNATIRNAGFEHWWLENNYEDYVSGSDSYSIDGNRMLLIGDGTPIAWTSAYQAGYQMVIDSQTHYGGGCDSLDFYKCAFNNAGVAQKSFLILSGVNITMYKPWITGGDIANRCKVTVDTEAFHIHSPIVDNDPTAVEQSLVANFGANMGTRGAYFKFGTSFGAAELGGTYPIVGVHGGPIHFKSPVAGDPRNADSRTLDDYFEGNGTYVPIWRLGSTLPFTVNSQFNTVTKIGRLVRLEMRCVVQVQNATSGNDKLYILNIPYAAATAGNLVGQAWIQPTNGGGILNGGLTPLYMLNNYDLYAVLDNFPALVVGHTYDIRLEVAYTSET